MISRCKPSALTVVYRSEGRLDPRPVDPGLKYVTAVRLGTAETEAILRRFVRSNIQHPTYKAFAELGKAVKTIFLCRYLRSEDLRREINDQRGPQHHRAMEQRQRFLAQPHWSGRLTGRDRGVLTPLFWEACQPVWALRARHERPATPID